MNKFEYRIYDSVYNDMVSGKKTIEFRLLNDKSERIKPKDEIKFEVVNDKNKSILVEVLDKYFYDDVNDLWNKEFKIKKVYGKFDFEDEIKYLEDLTFYEDYVIRKGNIPILFTAPHTMEQVRDDGTVKHKETYTKAIALYLNKYFNVNCMIKIKDTGIESNRDDYDKFKTELIRFVKEKNIKIVIDLHGSKRDRDYDIEFGTLNNLTSDYSTIKELEESFTENGILKIVHNDPFKGGAITRYLYGLHNVEVIQLEINKKYREDSDVEKLKKLVKSLENFIIQYDEYTKNRSM